MSSCHESPHYQEKDGNAGIEFDGRDEVSRQHIETSACASTTRASDARDALQRAQAWLMVEVVGHPLRDRAGQNDSGQPQQQRSIPHEPPWFSRCSPRRLAGLALPKSELH
jgi:hypothetical protein